MWRERDSADKRLILITALANQHCIDIPQTFHLFSPPPEPPPEPLNILTKNQTNLHWWNVYHFKYNQRCLRCYHAICILSSDWSSCICLRAVLWLVFSVMPLFNDIDTFTQQEVSCYVLILMHSWQKQELLSVMTTCKLTLMWHLCKNVQNQTDSYLLQINYIMNKFVDWTTSYIWFFFLFLSFFSFSSLYFFLSIILCIIVSLFVLYHSLYCIISYHFL